MNRSRFRYLFILFTIAAATGCQGLGSSRGYQRANYAWAFYNPTDQELSGVKLEYMVAKEQAQASAGVVVGHSGAADFDGWYPIPATGTLSWRTRDGQSHRQEIVIAGQLPNTVHFADGYIWFIYNGSTWTVSTVTYAEERDRALHGDYSDLPKREDNETN